MTARPIEVVITCPKCRHTSGECGGVCPMPGSPYYQPGWLANRRRGAKARPTPTNPSRETIP